MSTWSPARMSVAALSTACPVFSKSTTAFGTQLWFAMLSARNTADPAGELNSLLCTRANSVSTSSKNRCAPIASEICTVRAPVLSKVEAGSYVTAPLRSATPSCCSGCSPKAMPRTIIWMTTSIDRATDAFPRVSRATSRVRLATSSRNAASWHSCVCPSDPACSRHSTLQYVSAHASPPHGTTTPGDDSAPLDNGFRHCAQ
mmetsp:Transcript_53707/g.165227  ORF Transcript_53707/g.165227 Transcript_53707/m.165227 type:complete len:202 (-) Transcript_53707:544-1149(-)